MSRRFLIVLVSTLLLFQVVTSKPIHTYGIEESLCNNPVIDWLHLNIFEMKNWILDELLVILKSFLENYSKNSSSSAKVPVILVHEMLMYVRDVEIERNAHPNFNPEDALKTVAKFFEQQMFRDEIGHVKANASVRRKQIVEQFGVIFEKFVATLPRSEREKYEEFFAFHDHLASEKNLTTQFSDLAALERECTK